jgi:hypothetical protein
VTGSISDAPLRLTLYGRTWCHLCDDMRSELDELIRALRRDGGGGSDGSGSGDGAERSAVQIDVVDTDPSLEARYNERVPVLVLEDVELCHYRLDRRRVAEALLARRSVEGSPESGLMAGLFPLKCAGSSPIARRAPLLSERAFFA